MTKPNLGEINLTFGPGSAIVEHIKASSNAPPAWKIEDNELTLKFELDANAPPLPRNASYLASLLQARSPSTAESVLKGISYTLRQYADFDVPRDVKLALAAAIDRVVEEGASVMFLYGKQDRRGKPSKDLLEEFQIFQTVEHIHSSGEPYSASGSHNGAYSHTAELLQNAKITVRTEDEIRRIRRKVLDSAASDLEYFFQLIHYLREQGYKISQP